MSHEFQIHKDVNELFQLLGLSGRSGVGAEVLTDHLQRSITPFVSSQVAVHNAKRKLAETSPTPEHFLSIYDELKSKGYKELDALVMLLSKLQENPELTALLRSNATAQATAGGYTLSPQKLPSVSASPSQQSLEELEQMLNKDRLPTAYTDPEILRRITKPEQKHGSVPPQPDWLHSRPHLSLDFPTVSLHNSLEPVALHTLVSAEQEYVILEDLIHLMQGIDGRHIRSQPLRQNYDNREFSFSSGLDISIRELSGRCVPVCRDFSTVIRFIEEKSDYEYGLVNQALASVMKEMIKDYLILSAQLQTQLRHGDLSLHKMWFYLQPSMKTMNILASIANTINKSESRGGAVLSLLHDNTQLFIGDTEARDLCLHLTKSACVPYLDILEKWIYKGVVHDPQAEFLVEANGPHQDEVQLDSESADTYWQRGYSVCSNRCPNFLDTLAMKILDTGKYLNVVRHAGRHVQFPDAEDLLYTGGERPCHDQILRSHAYASRTLLDLLLNELDLVHKLRSVKRYFFMDQGDFIVQFMDCADDEMRKPAEEVREARLNSLLDFSLRCSTSMNDKYKDNLRVHLMRSDLVSQLFSVLNIGAPRDYRIDPTETRLSGLEAFSLDFSVEWPISIVLSKQTLTCYQILFRHLFYCKHVERQLCNVWVSNKTWKQEVQRSSWYRTAFALRQRMLHFVQNFQYYVAFEVIEPHWTVFINELKHVETLDDVLRLHNQLLDACLQDSMLTSRDMLRTMHQILMSSVAFCNYMQKMALSSDVEREIRSVGATLQKTPTLKQTLAEQRTLKKVVSDHLDDVTTSNLWEQTVLDFAERFNSRLCSLLQLLSTHAADTAKSPLENMLHRLNFNGFYKLSDEEEKSSTAAASSLDGL